MSSVTKSRYLNIDALRGVAAFLVVLCHLFGSRSIFTNFIAPEKLSFFNVLYVIPAYGYAGVFLFFVISGFCIHLRWAKAYSKGDKSPKIDFIAFWKRRWIRLYPAYLAAILLYLVWHYSQGELNFNTLFAWDVIAHTLMVHNFDSRTVYSINSVFWTLAIEEQLYLIYFLLLWMRNTLGWKFTLIACFLARFVWFGFILLLNRAFSIEIPVNEGALANWWIWALGALAVENYLGIVKFPKWCYSLLLAFGFILVAACLRYYGLFTPTYFSERLTWLFEALFWGAGFFFLTNWIMQYENQLKSFVMRNFVKICAAVGLFSYSLYLVHDFILGAFAGYSKLLLVFMTLAFAYIFFLLFEKPFMLYLSKQRN